jgi:arabinoxylan arabinofuranohydrolase
VLPSYEYVPDCEPHIFGDRLYLFGSHDKFGGDKFCLNDYVCWSAPVSDLSDWRYEGVIYKRSQDPENKNGELEMWAPDVAQGSDGRYYLYYCLSGDDSMLSVAVCNTPCGKYEFYGNVKDKNGKAVGRRDGDTGIFDPAVIVDDDGRVWLYYGNGPMKFMPDVEKKKASVCLELEPDMVTIKSEPKRLIPTLHDSKGTDFEGHEFFEASSIRKFNGRYYFIYSSVWCHELVYAISDWPDGGFKYGGTLISNGDINAEDQNKIDVSSKSNLLAKNYLGNNHGSLVEVEGRYYIFFHRQTNRSMFSRQACAIEIEMLPDGMFKQAELTSCGLNGGPLKGKGTYEAYIACHLYSNEGALFGVHPMLQNETHPALTQDGEDRDNAPDQYIQNMRDGATAGFRYFDFHGTSGISVSVRGNGKGKMIVRDGEGGEKVAEILLEQTAVWQTFSSSLHIKDGIKSLYFTYIGQGAVDFMYFTLT